MVAPTIRPLYINMGDDYYIVPLVGTIHELSLKKLPKFSIDVLTNRYNSFKIELSIRNNVRKAE